MGTKKRRALAASVASSLLYGLVGCCASCPVNEPSSTNPVRCECPIAANIRSASAQMELRASVGGDQQLASSMCTITLKNVGTVPTDVPDTDVGGHLGISVDLIDSGGKEATLTPLGEEQFRNFQGTFIGSRTVAPAESITWTVDLSKSFVIEPQKVYVVHVFYSCYDLSKWPEVELSGLRYKR